MAEIKGRGGDQRFNALLDQLNDAREADDDDKVREIESMLDLEFPNVKRRFGGSPPTGEMSNKGRSRGGGAATKGTKFKGVF